MNSLGQADKALQVLKTAHDRVPADFDIARTRITLLRDQGRADEARQEALELLLSFPQDRNARALLRSLVGSGQQAGFAIRGTDSLSGRRAEDDDFVGNCLKKDIFMFKLLFPTAERRSNMKLRVLNNSVRLRLTRSEVDEAAGSGIVKGRSLFPEGAVFNYVLESSPAIVDLTASFSGGDLTIRVPQSEVQSWAESERVSIVAEQLLENGQKLAILIEKDFACLTARESEDESDMFPHPLAGTDNC